jgi:hypothetical protein
LALLRVHAFYAAIATVGFALRLLLHIIPIITTLVVILSTISVRTPIPSISRVRLLGQIVLAACTIVVVVLRDSVGAGGVVVVWVWLRVGVGVVVVGGGGTVGVLHSLN